MQTSFAFVLFGTGILFCAWLAYKVLWEGIEPTFETVWFPVLGYIFLAPAVFLVPLFMFTGALRDARDRALVRLNVLALDVGQAFRDRWLGDEGPGGAEYLESTHSSNLADLHAAFEAVSEMRIVPFDRRSALELFSSSAVPFAPLLFIVEMEDKVRDVLQFFT